MESRVQEAEHLNQINSPLQYVWIQSHVQAQRVESEGMKRQPLQSLENMFQVVK